MRTKTTGAAAALAALIATPALAGEVRMTLDGVQARGGTVYVTLQREAEFMQPTGLAQRIEAPAAGSLTVVFPDVPAGDYALSAFHDENGDRRLDMSPGGMPVEGWAMSNAEALRGPPTFELVKVSVPAEGAQLTEPMNYMDGQRPTR